MAKKFDNISNNNVRIGANGLSGLFTNNTPNKESTPAFSTTPVAEPVAETTRQTFVILADDLKFIKDIVRARRMEGETEFTQKEALHHIIEYYRMNH